MEQHAEDAVSLSDLVFVQVDVQPLAAQAQKSPECPGRDAAVDGVLGFVGFAIEALHRDQLGGTLPQALGNAVFFRFHHSHDGGLDVVELRGSAQQKIAHAI